VHDRVHDVPGGTTATDSHATLAVALWRCGAVALTRSSPRVKGMTDAAANADLVQICGKGRLRKTT
jgi:hypothetical protein